MFWPAETSGSPEYFFKASAVSRRNLVSKGMPPGTAFRNDAIHPLKVAPVDVIPSAIASRPMIV